VVEQGGGFVSCRCRFSPPPLDLGAYRALEFEAARRWPPLQGWLWPCADGWARPDEADPPELATGLTEFDTSADGVSRVEDPPGSSLPGPRLRARPLILPLQASMP